MNFSDKAVEKLECWAGPSTWHTEHSSDMKRFYDFIELLGRENDYSLDESRLRERITAVSKEKHSSFDEEEREKVAGDLTQKASTIFQYLGYINSK